jgi:hypothetical protein
MHDTFTFLGFAAHMHTDMIFTRVLTCVFTTAALICSGLASARIGNATAELTSAGVFLSVPSVTLVNIFLSRNNADQKAKKSGKRRKTHK